MKTETTTKTKEGRVFYSGVLGKWIAKCPKGDFNAQGRTRKGAVNTLNGHRRKHANFPRKGGTLFPTPKSWVKAASEIKRESYDPEESYSFEDVVEASKKIAEIPRKLPVPIVRLNLAKAIEGNFYRFFVGLNREVIVRKEQNVLEFYELESLNDWKY